MNPEKFWISEPRLGFVAMMDTVPAGTQASLDQVEAEWRSLTHDEGAHHRTNRRLRKASEALTYLTLAAMVFSLGASVATISLGATLEWPSHVTWVCVAAAVLITVLRAMVSHRAARHECCNPQQWVMERAMKVNDELP